MAVYSSKKAAAREQKVTPLPVGQLTILCIVLLTESICSTVLIPYVGLYVAYMQHWSKESAGYSSGFLIGLFMLGQVVSGKMYGRLSDTYGRKICICVGALLCAFAMLFFGLSPNIWVACLWRFVHGLTASCSIVAKTMINDVTDKTNQARGFSLVSLTWGVGTLFGPSIGGFLYDPVHKTSLEWIGFGDTGVFARFPAFLPSVIVAMYNLFAFCVGVVFLRETHTQALPLRAILPRWAPSILGRFLDLIQPKLPNNSQEVIILSDVGMTGHGAESLDNTCTYRDVPNKDHRASSSTSSMCESGEVVYRSAETTTVEGSCVRDSDNSEEGGSGSAALSHSVSMTTPAKTAPSHRTVTAQTAAPAKPVESPFGYTQAFQNPLTRMVCIMSMLMSGSDMLYAETFALWAIVPLRMGGLGVDSSKLGVLILVNCIPSVISNIYLVQMLQIFKHQNNFWRMTHVGYATCSVMIPFAAFMGATGSYFWALFWGIVRKGFETWIFSILMLTVAQTAPPDKVGVMYGIQQSTACMVRCIVPFVGAPLFAWSVSGSHHFPFNHFLCFLLCAIPLVIGFFLSFSIHVPRDPDELEGDDVSDGARSFAGGAPHGERAAHLSERHGDGAAFNRSFGWASRHTGVHSRIGSDVSDESAVRMTRSFATLANSFAVNPMPCMLRGTLMPPKIDTETLENMITRAEPSVPPTALSDRLHDLPTPADDMEENDTMRHNYVYLNSNEHHMFPDRALTSNMIEMEDRRLNQWDMDEMSEASE